MPLNRVLKQIREQRHFGAEDVAAFTNISIARLLEFEAGERDPTFRQVEKLASAYGVPSYVFADKLLPNLMETLPDFRRADTRPARLSPAGMSKVWAAERVCQFTAQLAEELEVTLPPLIPESPSQSTVSAARSIRKIFDDWLSKRQSRLGLSGPPEQVFFAALRIFLEVQGIIVNVNDAPSEDFLGFYIGANADFPLVFVNRSISSKKAQLFTLVHEFAHHRIGAVGVSNPFIMKNKIERSCNSFAAEFLAPMPAFRSVVEKLSRGIRSDPDALINQVSAASLLSRHASAIRLYEGEYITQVQLTAWVRVNNRTPRAEKDEERDAAGESRGAVHAKRIGELGYLPTYLAKHAVDKKIIDRMDVQRGLSLSEGLQEAAFSLANRRFEVALSG